MSTVTLTRVNDYEIGTRRKEIQGLKAELERVKEFRPSSSAIVINLREELRSARSEYKELCSNVRNNFVW